MITYNARGYPPSDVPADAGAYSQDHAVEDLRGLLLHLRLAPAHVCGLSMGGYATLHLGLRYPELARSLVVAGCGYGSDDQAQFRRDAEELGRRIEEEGMAAFGATYARGPFRVQFMRKDPQGWQVFADALAQHSARGSAGTMRGVQGRGLGCESLAGIPRAPTLIVTGDEDVPCLAPGVFMKQQIPAAGLLILPRTGHTINLEEPEAFNRAVLDFLTLVESGRWPARDPEPPGRSALLPDAR